MISLLPSLFALFRLVLELGRQKKRESRLAFLNRFEQAADFIMGGHERDPAPLLSAAAVVLRMQFDYDHGRVVTRIAVVVGRDVDGDDFVVGLVVCGCHVGCCFVGVAGFGRVTCLRTRGGRWFFAQAGGGVTNRRLAVPDWGKSEKRDELLIGKKTKI